MKKEIVVEKVTEALREVMCDEERMPASVDEDFNARLSSVEFVTMIVEIETMFDIQINDDDFEISNMNTINKLADLVKKYINE